MRKASEAFGAAVTGVIKEHGLTQAQASIKTGVDRFTLGQMMQGVVPRMERVLDFVRGFNLDANEWLELAGYEPIPSKLDPNQALELVVEHAAELTYDDDLEGLDEVRKYEGFGKLSPQAQEAILSIVKAIATEDRRKQGRE